VGLDTRIARTRNAGAKWAFDDVDLKDGTGDPLYQPFMVPDTTAWDVRGPGRRRVAPALHRRAVDARITRPRGQYLAARNLLRRQERRLDRGRLWPHPAHDGRRTDLAADARMTARRVRGRRNHGPRLRGPRG